MGLNQSIQQCNFENIQHLSKNNNFDKYLLINVLDKNLQDILIENTINIDNESKIINNLLENNNKNIYIFVYGKNSNDKLVYKKYKQLIELGFKNTYIYIGGLFEWLLLQDIYGPDEFKTSNISVSSLPVDIIKYKPLSNINFNFNM